jgi:choline kinase
VISAVILAAGRGARLGDAFDGPKPLIDIGGMTLLERSVRQAQARGIADVVVVTGHAREKLEPLIRSLGAREARNDAFAVTGTLGSFAAGARATRGRAILLFEGDVLVDDAGVDALLETPSMSSLLASDPTRAGDEVWVEAPDGRVRALSKDRDALASADGEFVGVSYLLPPTTAALLGRFDGAAEARSYEEDGITAVAGGVTIALRLVPGLAWGEIDDERQWARVREQVWPRVNGR